jgi:acetyltransferase-like isoleucine patch superfamily enzyme
VHSKPNLLIRTIAKITLKIIQAWDRSRLAWIAHRNPGLRIDPTASTNFAKAKFDLGPEARLVIGAGVVTERNALGVRFELGAGAVVVIEDGGWLRSEVGPVFLRAFPGAQITIGPNTQLSACMLSAKQEVAIGRRVLIGMGTRIFDSDQHPVDVDHPEVTLPVRVEDDVWVAADVTVLRGVTIGKNSVVGTRSLVRLAVEPYTVVSGVPAKLYGKLGDRSALPR